MSRLGRAIRDVGIGILSSGLTLTLLEIMRLIPPKPIFSIPEELMAVVVYLITCLAGIAILILGYVLNDKHTVEQADKLLFYSQTHSPKTVPCPKLPGLGQDRANLYKNLIVSNSFHMINS